MYLNRFICLTAALLVSGCALWNSENGSSDERDDASDISHLDSGSAGAFADCLEIERMLDIDIDPAGQNPKFQPRIAFDGNAIWTVYTRSHASDSTYRDIIAARITCDEDLITTLIEVNTHPIPLSAPAPSIDIKGDTVHIVWNTEVDGDRGIQSTVAYRSYDLRGVPNAWEESFVKFELDDYGAPTSFYDADIVARPDGNAIIAATMNIIGQDKTQIVLQKIGIHGIIIDSATKVPFNSEPTQLKPSITNDNSGRVWVAWLEFVEPTNQHPRISIIYASFAPNTLQPSATTMLSTAQSLEVGPGFSKSIRDEDNILYAYQTSAFDIQLVDITQTSEPATLGGADLYSYYPSIATSGNQGAVVWFSQVDANSVEQRSLNIQAFSMGDRGLRMGEYREVKMLESLASAVLPGSPGLIALGGDDYFMVYQEGPSVEATVLRGRFIKIASPTE